MKRVRTSVSTALVRAARVVVMSAPLLALGSGCGQKGPLTLAKPAPPAAAASGPTGAAK
jgi:predicted small lipoprotein YifL